MDEPSITFRAIAEPQRGKRFRARFEEAWPTYRRWFLRDGDGARPSYAVARRMLHEHMPELVPAWTQLVELAAGGDLAARMLALYDPPPLVSGCSQAVLGGGDGAVLVRNYDFDPALLEGVIGLTALRGEREEDAIAAFLAPPLHATAYGDGFGTLYTAVHRPADGAVEYRWPLAAWRQSFAAFDEGARTIAVSPAPLRTAA